MEQKKIEHITLHLMVFSTIVVIGVLARQTALHYGWDEFSSYLILVVCSIVMSAIYFNLQMVFTQILSPAIEKCFLRFECYRSKIVVVEGCPEAIEEVVDIDPLASEALIEVETTSDTSEEVSTSRSVFHTLLSLAGIQTPESDESAALDGVAYREQARVYLNDRDEAVSLPDCGMGKEDVDYFLHARIRP